MSARSPLSLRRPPADASLAASLLTEKEATVIDATRVIAFGPIQVLVHQHRGFQMVKNEPPPLRRASMRHCPPALMRTPA